jgi:protein OS-9
LNGALQTKGWWTYEFCYEKDIKQYHLEGREVLGEVVYLGRYSSEKEWANDKEEEIKV